MAKRAQATTPAPKTGAESLTHTWEAPQIAAIAATHKSVLIDPMLQSLHRSPPKHGGVKMGLNLIKSLRFYAEAPKGMSMGFCTLMFQAKSIRAPRSAPLWTLAWMGLLLNGCSPQILGEKLSDQCDLKGFTYSQSVITAVKVRETVNSIPSFSEGVPLGF